MDSSTKDGLVEDVFDADCLSSRRVSDGDVSITYLDVAHDGFHRHPSIGPSIDDQHEAKLPFVVTSGGERGQLVELVEHSSCLPWHLS